MTRSDAMTPLASIFVLACVLSATLLTGCRSLAPPAESAEVAIRAVLDQQARDWNEGSIERFMQGYAKRDDLRFASGGEVQRGWQPVFDRYLKKYGDRAAMGRLTFSDVEVTMLSTDAALVLGRWRLQRERDEPSGLFTLVFRKQPEGWRIVHDHTSAAETK
jgi:ketosteroid isomerase-like protein